MKERCSNLKNHAPVGAAVYIYTNQLVSKQASNKSQKIKKMKNDGKHIENDRTKYTKV